MLINLNLVILTMCIVLQPVLCFRDRFVTNVSLRTHTCIVNYQFVNELSNVVHQEHFIASTCDVENIFNIP